MERARPGREGGRGERGSALILVLFVSVVALLLGLMLSYTTHVDSFVAVAQRDREAARYVAETGLKVAEVALQESFNYQGWNDDLGAPGTDRPAHGADQPPQSLADTSLNRNGLVVYRWGATGTPTAALYRVPATVRGLPARYTVWVRNNPDDYGATVQDDADDTVIIVSLGEVLDPTGRRVIARSYLSERLTMRAPDTGQYAQEGLGAGGAATIEE